VIAGQKLSASGFRSCREDVLQVACDPGDPDLVEAVVAHHSKYVNTYLDGLARAAVEHRHVTTAALCLISAVVIGLNLLLIYDV
jgi:hypothetical protein